MKKPNRSYFLFFLATAFSCLFIFSCSKEISVNAKWKDITIIFGLLDQNNSVHYVKINKAFLGEADAFDMAQIRDSSEYDNVDAVIQEWKDGSLKNSFILEPTIISDKEEGIFYGPEQTVYSFEKSRLDSSATYKIVATINKGSENEKIVSAQTELIDNIKTGGFLNVYRNVGFPLANTSDFVNPQFTIISTIDAKRYEVYGVFHYTEHFEFSSGDTASIPRQVEFLIGEYKSKTTQGGEEINVNVSAEQIFIKIGQEVPDLENSDENLVKRVVELFELKIVAGGEDLNTYLEVNEPTTGIVQDKKEYTNIENGIGIFSSRTSKTEFLKLDNNSISELMFGLIAAEKSGTGNGYTTNRGFCNNFISNTECEACFPKDGVDPCR